MLLAASSAEAGLRIRCATTVVHAQIDARQKAAADLLFPPGTHASIWSTQDGRVRYEILHPRGSLPSGTIILGRVGEDTVFVVMPNRTYYAESRFDPPLRIEKVKSTRERNEREIAGHKVRPVSTSLVLTPRREHFPFIGPFPPEAAVQLRTWTTGDEAFATDRPAGAEWLWQFGFGTLDLLPESEFPLGADVRLMGWGMTPAPSDRGSGLLRVAD